MFFSSYIYSLTERQLCQFIIWNQSQIWFPDPKIVIYLLYYAVFTRSILTSESITDIFEERHYFFEQSDIIKK